MHKNLEDTLLLVANRMRSIENNSLTEECSISIIDINSWEWAQGVGLYGLYRYYQQSKDKSILDYLENWFDNNISKGLPNKNINTVAPVLTLTYIAEILNRTDYFELINEWAEWVMTKLPRTEDCGFQHVTTDNINEGELWADTLFMTVLFLARAGVLLNRQDMLDECERQFLVHIKYLFDKKTGLWFHGWTFKKRDNFADARWARGNCWITIGIPDYLEIAPVSAGVRKYLIDTLVSQASALQKYQDESGMWHTLIDCTDSYLETSATAGFGYGILKAVRMGILPRSYQIVGEKALAAVLNKVSNDGTVLDVSYGTGMGMDLQHYKDISICPMTYGQALSILIFGEGVKNE